MSYRCPSVERSHHERTPERPEPEMTAGSSPLSVKPRWIHPTEYLTSQVAPTSPVAPLHSLLVYYSLGRSIIPCDQLAALLLPPFSKVPLLHLLPQNAANSSSLVCCVRQIQTQLRPASPTLLALHKAQSPVQLCKRALDGAPRTFSQGTNQHQLYIRLPGPLRFLPADQTPPGAHSTSHP
jgi:hypothetical protein